MKKFVKKNKRKNKTKKLRKIKNKIISKNKSLSKSINKKIALDLTVANNGAEGVNIGNQDMSAMVFDENEIDEPPLIISKTAIPYPKRAKQQKLEGIASIILLINREGSVEKITFESLPSPFFKKAIKQSVMRWKFRPAKYKGVAVKVLMRQNIKFELMD